MQCIKKLCATVLAVVWFCVSLILVILSCGQVCDCKHIVCRGEPSHFGAKAGTEGTLSSYRGVLVSFKCIRGSKVDRSDAQGALVDAPQAPRGVGCGKGVSRPQKIFYYFTSKWNILVLYLSWI